MSGIVDYNKYTDGMKKSLTEKIFFIDKVEFDVLYDFGCADGAVIKYLAELFPDKQFVGVEVNANLRLRALNKAPENVTFTDKLPTSLSKHDRNVLLLSSVLHEVYSYMEPSWIDQFWRTINELGFDYVVVRDMFKPERLCAPAPQTEVAKILAFGDKEQVLDYINHRSNFKTVGDMLDYLLKYRYIENWAHEMHEDYLSMEKVEPIARLTDFGTVYEDVFIHQYTRDHVMRDFGININIPTHFKAIYKKDGI